MTDKMPDEIWATGPSGGGSYWTASIDDYGHSYCRDEFCRYVRAGLATIGEDVRDIQSELEISRKRVQHYMRENTALREQIEIYKAAHQDELQ